MNTKNTDITELSICADCANIIANGVDTADPEQREHVRLMVIRTADWRGTLVVGDQSHDFAVNPCDVCGTDLAGTRFEASLLG